MFVSKGLSTKVKRYVKAHLEELSPGFADYLTSLTDYIGKAHNFEEAKNMIYVYDLYYTCRSKSEFSNLNTMYALYEALHKNEDIYFDFIQKVRAIHFNCNEYTLVCSDASRIALTDNFDQRGIEVLDTLVSPSDFYAIMREVMKRTEKNLSDIPISLVTRINYEFGGKSKHVDLELGDTLESLFTAHQLFISWVHSIPSSALIKNSEGISQAVIKRERKLMTFDLRSQILARDKCTCQICGSREDLQVDHIVPVSRGGRTIEWNLVTLCRRCNMDKSNKIRLLEA